MLTPARASLPRSRSAKRPIGSDNLVTASEANSQYPKNDCGRRQARERTEGMWSYCQMAQHAAGMKPETWACAIPRSYEPKLVSNAVRCNALPNSGIVPLCHKIAHVVTLIANTVTIDLAKKNS